MSESTGATALFRHGKTRVLSDLDNLAGLDLNAASIITSHTDRHKSSHAPPQKRFRSLRVQLLIHIA